MNKEDYKTLHTALSLLNSMVNGGEQHTKQSVEVTENAFRVLNNWRTPDMESTDGRHLQPQVIYVDIDGTICRTGNRVYENAVPIFENIKKINKLAEDGNKIIYWTARGNSSGINWREVTLKQLNEWGCKFFMLSDEKKPSFDLLIDDRTKRIEEI
jgi:hypothetical protein